MLLNTKRVLLTAVMVIVLTMPARAQEAPDSSEAAPAETAVSPSSVIDVLELSDMDVLDVIKLIVQKTGLNIVVGQNVTGKVTIYLKDVDARDALRIILESNGLAYGEEGNILRVMTAQDYEIKYGHKFDDNIQTKIMTLSHAEAADIYEILTQMKTSSGKVIVESKSNSIILMDNPTKIAQMEKSIQELDTQRFTQVFELSYAKASDLSEKVQEMLTKNMGKVKFDERSNKLIVTDTAAKIEEVKRVVDAIDQRDRQVLIEARIVQITLNDEHRMGVDWEAIVSNYHGVVLGGSFSNLPLNEKRGKLSVGTLSKDDYTVLLEALDTVGSVDILSSPSIMTINNKEARILVGSTQPYVTTTTTTPSSGPATTAEAVNFIDVGVKLFVTPTVHTDGFITMKIRPEVSSVSGQVSTGNNNMIPIVDTSEAETTVNAKDGATMVIGGLIKEEKTKMIKKVPILGDIPFLGVAFRSHSRSFKKTEIVIFLTPKISTGEAFTLAAPEKK